MMSSQRAILILGAGRSGTSTLTRGLAALGVYLGAHFRRPVRKNPRGSFEEVHLLKLSKSVRNRLGLRADSVRLLTEEDWQSARLSDLQSRVRTVIEREFQAHPLWAFKYAGSGRILPFWLDLLPQMDIEPAFTFAYRNPLSIARSRAELHRLRGRPEHNNLEWLANVVPYFDRLNAYDSAVVDYDRLVGQPEYELHRLAQRLHLPVTAQTEASITRFAREFVRSEWRHTRFSDDDLIADPDTHPLVRRAAPLLSRLARDELSMDDPALWAEWRQIQQELEAQAPVLRLVDQLQADARRARWWDPRHLLRAGWNKLPLLRVP